MPPVVLFPFPAWPPAQASRVLSGFDDGRTLDLPSAPATASAHGNPPSPRGYHLLPGPGLFASVMLVNRAPSHSSSQSRPHDLAAQQALCDHSTKYSQLASGHSASPHAALPQRTSAGYSHRIESSPKRH